MSSERIFQVIKERLNEKSILFSEDGFADRPTVVGYDKVFKWRWMATQMNTFIVVADFGNEIVSPMTFAKLFHQSFGYAKLNYSGWPRGVQSSMAVIAVIISTNIDSDAVDYCKELKVRKSWAGFSVPVAIDASTDQVHVFNKNPLRGIIYYPYFKRLIAEIT
jgi:hypothetical protein